MSNWLAEAVAKENAYKEEYEAGKQTAVEQIFKELESILILNKTTHCGQRFYFIHLEDDIAELKKKYEVK